MRTFVIIAPELVPTENTRDVSAPKLEIVHRTAETMPSESPPASCLSKIDSKPNV
jgi:hypothetical protein